MCVSLIHTAAKERKEEDAPWIAPSCTGSPIGNAITFVMLAKSSAMTVSFAQGMCSASLPGIVFVQIAPATALPTAPPISVQRRTIAVVIAMSACGTDA